MAKNYLYQENSFAAATQTLTTAGTVTVQHDAYVLVSGGDGFDLLAPAAWTMVIDGAVSAGADVISMADSSGGVSSFKNSLLTIGVEGTLTATGGVGSI